MHESAEPRKLGSMSASAEHDPAVSRYDFLAYWFTIAMIALAIVLMNIFTRASEFADFDTYVLYLDRLVYYPPDTWLYVEPLSNFLFLIVHWLARSVELAVVYAHYLTGFIFIVLLIRAYPSEYTDWKTLFFVFALLGPLLAFVTIRATPAYFLVATAVYQAANGRRSSWGYLVAAFLFHISTVLAVLPVALLYFREYLPRFLNSRNFLSIFMSGILAAGLVIPQLTDSAASFIESIAPIAKYSAYIPNNDEVVNIGHYIFLVFMILFTAAYFILEDKEASALNLYLAASFAIYLFLFVAASPVAAFRQAPFWLLPMAAFYPWARLGLRGPTAVVFLIASAGLFAYQFESVYSLGGVPR